VLRPRTLCDWLQSQNNQSLIAQASNMRTENAQMLRDVAATMRVPKLTPTCQAVITTLIKLEPWLWTEVNSSHRWLKRG